MMAIDNTKAIRELLFIDEQIRLLQVQRERLLWRTAGIKRGDVVVLTDWAHRDTFAKAAGFGSDHLEPGARPMISTHLQTREGWGETKVYSTTNWRPLAKGEAAPSTEGER